MVTREQWGAREPGLLKAYDGDYSAITLHHTGRHYMPKTVEDMQWGGENWFREPLPGYGLAQEYNMSDVGYNYMIDEAGNIYRGRALGSEGAHIRGHNTGNIGVALLGDYTNRPLTPAQSASLNALVTSLRRNYPISSVKTHGDYDPKKHGELAGARRQIEPLLNRARP